MLGGLIGNVMSGVGGAYANVAKGELDNQQKLDYQQRYLQMVEEKDKRIAEFTQDLEVAGIGRKAEATAAAAPVLARGKAAAAPIEAEGEAQGLIAKVGVPGYTGALQSETDAKESTSTKDLRDSTIGKNDAEIRKIDNEIQTGGGLKEKSRDRLTTIVNSANATIKSLNEGSRGKTAEEKAEWKRQMDEAIALRDRATSLLRENIGGSKASPDPASTPSPAKPGGSKPSASRPPLTNFDK